nr:DNA repair protein RadA-like isoform X1 [Ipomoea batatas]
MRRVMYFVYVGSFLECPVPVGFVFIGEIGLGGELRTVPLMDKRVNTVAKLGYKKCIVPKSAVKSLVKLELGDIEIVGCSFVKLNVDAAFDYSNNVMGPGWVVCLETKQVNFLHAVEGELHSERGRSSLSIREALSWIKGLGWHCIQVESDAKLVI